MAIPNFVLLLYTPRPPPPSVPLLTYAKTVPLQLYQIHLHLRVLDIHCGLRDNVSSLENSMDVLEKDLLRKRIENL